MSTWVRVEGEGFFLEHSVASVPPPSVLAPPLAVAPPAPAAPPCTPRTSALILSGERPLSLPCDGFGILPFCKQLYSILPLDSRVETAFGTSHICIDSVGIFSVSLCHISLSG